MSSAICLNLDQSKILSSGSELSETLACLITVIRTSLIKFYLNTQRMSDSFYHIIEKYGSKTYLLCHVLEFFYEDVMM